jgi:hypothetical protein
MALSDRDYVARRKKKRSRPAGKRRPGQSTTWLGVNRAFVIGALIVVLLGLATYVFSLTAQR